MAKNDVVVKLSQNKVAGSEGFGVPLVVLGMQEAAKAYHPDPPLPKSPLPDSRHSQLKFPGYHSNLQCRFSRRAVPLRWN